MKVLNLYLFSVSLDAIRQESPYLEPYMDHLEKDYAEYNEGNSDHTKYFVDYSYSSYEDSFYAVASGRLTIALQNNGWEVYDHFINSEHNLTKTGLIPTINVDKALVNESLSHEWDSWVNNVGGAVLNKDIVLLGNTFDPELQFSSWTVKFFGMYDYMIMEYYLELVFIFDNEKAEWVFSHTNFKKSRENWEPLFNTIWSCANPENGQRDYRVQIEYLATDDASIGNQVMWIDGLRYTFRKGRQLAIYSSDRHDLLIFTNNGGVVLWIDPAEGVYYIEIGEGSSENERVHTDFDIGDKSRFLRMHCEGAGSFTNPDINSDLLEGGTWETVN